MLHVQRSRCWVHHASTALDSHNSLIQQIAENIHQRFGPVDMIDMVMAPEAEPDI